jgi:hypothetical protein
MNKNSTLLLISIAFIYSAAFATMPNPSFENWNNGMPDGWTVNNYPPDLIPITASTDAYDGTYALKGEVTNYNGNGVPPNVTPTSVSGMGFPINKRYVDFTGMYKSDLYGNDISTITIVVYHSSGTSIGYGFGYLPGAANYTRFTVPINYSFNAQPSYAHITITMVDSTGLGFHVGSNIILDAMDLEEITGLSILNKQQLNVFPNPANAKINFSENFTAGKIYSIKMFNESGQIVVNSITESIDNSLSPVDINLIPEGIYQILISDAEQKNNFSQKILISRK